MSGLFTVRDDMGWILWATVLPLGMMFSSRLVSVCEGINTGAIMDTCHTFSHPNRIIKNKWCDLMLFKAT
ncbi:hypothetical protein ARMSODRAFT_967343 [Armillaria solidipes]|uniref:Uncharacterized protein n=1 Tax=Armillaria solidipes TaxID=1076256 RepID=A0A2H3B787_9AGAR|nr:hypothetical protein ARMSODRAFT_967343 [Armillaria solidipes]